MKNLFKYLDPFQIVGFSLSVAISVYLIRATDDPPISLLIGLALGIAIQLFDLQVRLMASSERLESLSIEGVERTIRSLDGVGLIRFKDSQQLYVKRKRQLTI